MARNVNKVILVGNVGRDAEVRMTRSGKAVANFSLATNGRQDSEGNSKVEWHRITCWEGLAVFAGDYIKTGTRLYVEGRLSYGSYDRDGISIPTCDIVAKDVVLLGGSNPQPDTGSDDQEGYSDDDLD